MNIHIDTNLNTLTYSTQDDQKSIPLYSDQAFEILSTLWLKTGWNQKYPYTFSWLGRPVIQLPEDMLRIQEVIYQIKPDVILETGVAHGGSLIYYASLCHAMGKGRVVGIDIIIRPHNRQAIENHELSQYIELIEGNAVSQEVVALAKNTIKPGESVLVILDSCHTKAHVAQELEVYHSLVTRGSYIVATDGYMRYLNDVPRGNPEWAQDNPISAVEDFLTTHREFVLEQPKWPFNESTLTRNITYWPSSFLRRI